MSPLLGLPAGQERPGQHWTPRPARPLRRHTNPDYRRGYNSRSKFVGDRLKQCFKQGSGKRLMGHTH